MRKKSHISLAKYMVKSLNDEGLKKHKLSFYLGSILPDIKPSFLYRRHEMNETFPDVRRKIARLSEGRKAIRKNGRKYYMDLGQISHYLADYFTFPHNETYDGGLKEHCTYEKKLKHDLRSYIRNREDGHFQRTDTQFGNADALCDFIEAMHQEYLGRKHNVQDDILHIIDINQRALCGMMTLLARRRAECRA